MSGGQFGGGRRSISSPAIDPTSGVKRRGFASMTPERRREIASMGGKQVQLEGRGHRFTSEEAAAAGRKGGQARQRGRTTKPPVRTHNLT